ncbi:MAG: methyltransferase family protein, partial [Anaerolineae bacterium]
GNMTKRPLINLASAALALWLFPYLITHNLPPLWEGVLIVGCTGWTYLASWLGRRALRTRSGPTPSTGLRQAQPDCSGQAISTAEGMAWVQLVTNVVHYAVAIPLATSLILAGKWAVDGRALRLPALGGLTAAAGWVLLVPGAILVVAAVLNLAIKGLGAPWAAKLSARLASDWLYRYTRNPMVLGGFGTMLGLGLVWHSALFFGWALVGWIPALVFFLKTYEEEELAARFGADYLAYRARTPFLLPLPRRLEQWLEQLRLPREKGEQL